MTSFLVVTIVCAAILAVLSPECVEATGNDVHYVEPSAGHLTMQDFIERFPVLIEIMEELQTEIIPLDHIIKNRPELWQKFKDDPEVWAWFQKNMPHYTKDRIRTSAKRPFAAPTAELQFLLDIEKSLQTDYGSVARIKKAKLPRGDQF